METYFIKDDGGRKEAGYQGTTGDCVVRAIAIAAQLPYQKVYDDLHELNKLFAQGRSRKAKKAAKNTSPRDGTFREVYHPYLVDGLGFEWVSCMQIGSGCKVHLRADELPKGRLVTRLSGHLAAVIDGVIHDNHDPSRGGTRCVYGYYRKSL